ncbi:MAG: peptidoglycan DD-metalloendopeptidase family protein [Lachnospiraceae bacterium]|nr:peptidoglycan DD-metalloendopeptidase family protein [Lachnospiraceae bacterium]
MMRKKGFIKGLGAFLALILLVSFSCGTVSAAPSLTNDFIRESEENKKEAEKNKASLKSGLTDVKGILKNLESAKGNLEEYISQLDEQLTQINAKIEVLKQQITDKELAVQAATMALNDAQNRADAQYEAMKLRVKFMYERGNDSMITMLISSDSFVDFLNRAEFINRISAYDRKMLDEFIATRNEIAAIKADLEEEKRQLDEAKAAMDNEQAAMETLIASKQEEIGVYETDIKNKEAAIAEYEAMIAEQDQIIKDLEKAILAEKKRLLEQNRKAIVYDGGQFKWPAPDYTRISDDYGWRTHPILGIKQFHNGVDMAAPSGSPILAAYDGEVVSASYSATMGNYIIIDHGDGLFTVYMHASALLVSEGQMVARGEQIAKVGSTGRSTGPHLHFTVRKDGNYISPWNYLG